MKKSLREAFLIDDEASSFKVNDTADYNVFTDKV